MSKVKFNLRKPGAKTPTRIMMVFHYQSDKLRLSTGLSILPKYWNQNKQRAKELMEFYEHTHINSHLESISARIIEVYDYSRQEFHKPSKELLKASFNASSNWVKKEDKTFWELYDDFVEYKRKNIKDVRDYHNSLRKHLKVTEKRMNKPVSFLSIKKLDGGFIDEMNNYLTYHAINKDGLPGHSVNTIGKQFKNLKVFLNWCFEREYCERFSLKHIQSKQEFVESVYLNLEEKKSVINLKLNGLDEKVRDCFVLGCEIGFRFSDLLNIKPAHIESTSDGYNIKIQQQKTNEQVIVPLSTTAYRILKKYNLFSPTPNIRSEEFNKKIKQICKLAGIDKTVNQYRRIRGKTKQFEFKKYELISSHTCRRTFTTLLVLKKAPTPMIMKITGHKTERNFFRYVRLEKEVNANLMRKFIS